MSSVQVELLILGGAQCSRGIGQLGGCFHNGALTGRSTTRNGEIR